ncbi:DUF2452 domain-containing protein [Sediminibacterium ginsengisoli]|uniref:DUF2452 domain-containing protein n=1 Tax=Sediminibacterium ginsengisoli TaxID=413434 RepID=A0A1T4RX44_9BACT|nr:DUF2452 domain-containing protein [Sediminibacterium ginsengisoli]SKA20574.1 Protein of unknown function [Sediminibacterium ginsengisoli]
MTKAYNFLASWQLFPEKCRFEHGVAPKSGNYRIESPDDIKLRIIMSWVTIEDEAFHAEYEVVPDGLEHPLNGEDADQISATVTGSHYLLVRLLKAGNPVLEIEHNILPNGYMQVIQKGKDSKEGSFTNTEIYHKQLSVLPYAASVGGVAIRATKEGMIRHSALTAMEEQTEMQLLQIRQQIELLARQAQEIRKRKELSLMIYDAKLSFKPVIGQVYHLYEKKDGTHTLSMVAPSEWGAGGPFRQFIASVKLLADHTWVEVE